MIQNGKMFFYECIFKQLSPKYVDEPRLACLHDVQRLKLSIVYKFYLVCTISR